MYTIYNDLPMRSIRKMQLAENSAARLIKRTTKRAHMTPILRELHWLPVVKRFQMLLFTFKSLNNVASTYICELLNRYEPNRPLRSACAINTDCFKKHL